MNGLKIVAARQSEGLVKRLRNGFLRAACLLGATCAGNAALANTTHHHRYAGSHITRHRAHYAFAHHAYVHRATTHLASEAHHHYIFKRYEEYAGVRVYYGHEYAHYDHHQYAAYHYRGAHYRYASARYRHSYLQCVPYAREISHIDLSGDAFLWWAEAAGRYARGNQPVEGAVLNFRPVGRMPLGHVAVVTSVIDSRTILTTQANWVPGTITNDVTMQDVSANNDWSEVEVELGDSSKWGAPYPTYGFIYNQPDDGSVIANAVAQGNEVAEAPAPATVDTEAPDRNLR